MLDIASVTKLHGDGASQIAALDDVSLSISKGEFVALIGPSGSGKSTLMNIMGLLDRPSSGEIRIDGRSVVGLKPRELAALRGRTIGFIFQAFHLLPRLTALQNVVLPLRYQSVSQDEREERARRLLERVGLSTRASHRPDELSGGQRQRVAICRALVGNPRVILADEPTGNLDSKSADDIMALLVDLNRGADPVTIVMVTHDPSLAARCSRAVQLLDGRIVADSRSRLS